VTIALTHSHTHTHAHTPTHPHTHARTHNTYTHVVTFSFLSVISSDKENSAAAYVKGKQAGSQGHGTRPAVAAAPSTQSLASVKKGAVVVEEEAS